MPTVMLSKSSQTSSPGAEQGPADLASGFGGGVCPSTVPLGGGGGGRGRVDPSTLGAPVSTMTEAPPSAVGGEDAGSREQATADAPVATLQRKRPERRDQTQSMDMAGDGSTRRANSRRPSDGLWCMPHVVTKAWPREHGHRRRRRCAVLHDDALELTELVF